MPDELSAYSTDHLMSVILERVYPTVQWDDSVDATAVRVVRFLQEFTPVADPPFNPTVFDFKGDQMIVCGPIAFTSICQHHLLPYMGHAWVAYLSHGRIIGASKMPRLVKWCATQPSTQETLMLSITHWLRTWLNPKGTMVVMKAVHTCMSCRGVRESSASLINSLPSGVFLSEPGAKAEFFALTRLEA